MSSPSIVLESDGVLVERVVLDPLENNCWIVTSPSGGVLVDAPSNAGLLVDVARDRGIRNVLITHGHHDHIGAAPRLAAAGLELWIGAADADGHPWVTHRIEADTELTIDSLVVRAVLTPGHTPGSVCFLVGERLCCSGDTLFPGGPGKTTSPEAFVTIMRSIRTQLFDRLDDACVVLPGHGATTTIGRERPALPAWEERGW